MSLTHAEVQPIEDMLSKLKRAIYENNTEDAENIMSILKKNKDLNVGIVKDMFRDVINFGILESLENDNSDLISLFYPYYRNSWSEDVFIKAAQDLYTENIFDIDLRSWVLALWEFVPISTFVDIIDQAIKNKNSPAVLEELLWPLRNRVLEGYQRRDIKNLLYYESSYGPEVLNVLIDTFARTIEDENKNESFPYIPQILNSLKIKGAIKRLISNESAQRWFTSGKNVKYLVELFDETNNTPSLLGSFLEIEFIPELYDKFEITKYFRSYARSLIHSKCQNQDQISILKNVYKNFICQTRRLGKYREQTSVMDEMFELFKDNYRYFMKEKILKNRNNQIFMDYIDRERAPQTNTKSTPLVQKERPSIRYLDTDQLLILAFMILNECEGLDGARDSIRDLRLIELEGLIEEHREACRSSAYSMSLDERRNFIEKVWSKELKNKPRIDRYLKDNDFMCGLIEISLFCQDLRRNFSREEIIIISKSLGKYTNIDDENFTPKTMCKFLEKSLFQHLKKDAENLGRLKREAENFEQSSAKRQRKR